MDIENFNIISRSSSVKLLLLIRGVQRPFKGKQYNRHKTDVRFWKIRATKNGNRVLAVNETRASLTMQDIHFLGTKSFTPSILKKLVRMISSKINDYSHKCCLHHSNEISRTHRHNKFLRGKIWSYIIVFQSKSSKNDLFKT